MPRHLVITDSGFGGLSLVARLEPQLEATGTRITYVNACPSDSLGYNAMASFARKRQTFANVLAAIVRRFSPDAIVVACNTLSTILPACPQPPCPTRGILAAGQRLLDAARPGGAVLALATATTVAARPWGATGIVYRACPGLESMISSGSGVELELARIASEQPELTAVLLGCTHYSFRASAFARAFRRGDREVEILDPVAALAAELGASLSPCHRPGIPGPAPAIRFVTRYAPPQREIETIAALLAETAPRSAAAVSGYELDEQLFAG